MKNAFKNIGGRIAGAAKRAFGGIRRALGFNKSSQSLSP